jgi:hypothetical protein
MNPGVVTLRTAETVSLLVKESEFAVTIGAGIIYVLRIGVVWRIPFHKIDVSRIE